MRNARNIRNGKLEITECVLTHTMKITIPHRREPSVHDEETHRIENHGKRAHTDCENDRLQKRAQWTRGDPSQERAQHQKCRSGMECVCTRIGKTTASHGGESNSHDAWTHKRNAHSIRNGEMEITECVHTQTAKMTASLKRESRGLDTWTHKRKVCNIRNAEAEITECVQPRTAKMTASHRRSPMDATSGLIRGMRTPSEMET